VNTAERARLSKMNTKNLLKYCKEHNINLPENWRNKRYLIRAIETRGQKSNDRQKITGNYLVLGIKMDKNILRQRIEDRAEKIFSSGIVEETKKLAKKYDWESEAMKSNIYAIVWQMIQGKIGLAEAKKLFILDDWHLARRQLTWFRRNKDIAWLSSDEIEKFLVEKLGDL
jgi:tRNA dimethylallyltransferase